MDRVVDFGMGRLDAVLAFAREQPRFFVYAISDLAGKPVYVGSTTHPERRYGQHKGGSRHWQPELTAWMQAHLDAHVFEVLDTYPTKRMMLDAELEYIAYLRPALNLDMRPHALRAHNKTQCSTPEIDHS